ncbi:MAG: lysophospholipid acyltransferase family protein [Phycisphaerales bacterium]|nr:lysophospholipid acyltransferase family protein [Phycisphaerales bacterium]
MSKDQRYQVFTAQEIERKFRRPLTRVMRPLVLLTTNTLRVGNRITWELQGAEYLEEATGPFVLASNHRSHVDTVSILGLLPKSISRRTVVAAAQDVFGRQGTTFKKRLMYGFVGLAVAAGFRAFAFDRNGPPLASIRTSRELIKRGWNLLLYPEGTRTRTGKMKAFKSGVGALARFTGSPVLPIYVSGGDQVMPAGRVFPTRAHICVKIGKPLYFQDQSSPRRFTARLERAVRQLGGEEVSARLNARAEGISQTEETQCSHDNQPNSEHQNTGLKEIKQQSA